MNLYKSRICLSVRAEWEVDNAVIGIMVYMDPVGRGLLVRGKGCNGLVEGREVPVGGGGVTERVGSKVDKKLRGCVWRISKCVFGDPRRASAGLVGRYNGGQVVPGGWWV